MDSMRSLNSSLPTSTPLSKHQPNDQLLQAFKSAALSVTNLYKSSASSQADARQQGYQDALEDLLVFLDKENLGLMDGEGWKVRQWATERFSRGVVGVNTSDDEEDNTHVDEESRARSSSPVRQHTHSQSASVKISSDILKDKSSVSATTTLFNENTQPQMSTINPPMFTFSAVPQSDPPHDTDMAADQSSVNNPGETTTSIHLSESPARLDTYGRPSRAAHRHGTRDRNGHRSGTRELRMNAGTKRRLPVPDFFNLSNFDNGNGRDSFGGAGSKRGKFV